jgi:hypothetical protein
MVEGEPPAERVNAASGLTLSYGMYLLRLSRNREGMQRQIWSAIRLSSAATLLAVVAATTRLIGSGCAARMERVARTSCRTHVRVLVLGLPERVSLFSI